MQQIIECEYYLRQCCGKITSDQTKIDDAIQEAYLWLLERERTTGLEFLNYNGEPNKFYLRLLAVDKLRYRLRSDRKRTERDHESALQHKFDYEEPKEPESYACAAEAAKAILEQEPYDRELLKLVYYAKIKQKDLAETLGIPYTTLKKDVKEARERVREKINEYKETWKATQNNSEGSKAE